jgi:hypothetical protein
MRLDEVTAEIRPRSDWEAVDLGLAMVRRDFWRCLTVWWLAVLPVFALCAWLLWDLPALWLLVFWWAKPWGSRMVLFEISRRLFGEKPTWKAALREVPRAWVRRFPYRMLWARLSPWLPLTIAVEDLEGLRGKAYSQRSSQVTRRGESAMMWIYLIADVASCWFGLAILMIVIMFIPEGQDGGWKLAVETWNPDMPTDIPVVIIRTVSLCVMAAMSLTDVFVTGCGFGVYINNRTWVEGWDVELALKRLGRRLTRVVAVIVAVCFLTVPSRGMERPEPSPAEVMKEVKAHKDFKVHIVKDREPRKRTSSWKWPGWLSFGNVSWLGDVFVVGAVALLVGLIVWLVWISRNAFRGKGGGGGDVTIAPRARVVMGMEVSRESLPRDIPSAALALWREGRHHEALGLLYRGAISMAIDVGRVEIQESDTEGDCVRRVEGAGAAAHPEYFRGLTRVWTALAYAGMTPRDPEVESLCRGWPFVERRGA